MIRAATPDDAFAIAKVHVRAYRAAYRDVMLDEHLASFSEDVRARVFSEYIRAGTYAVDVLDLDGVAGFCTYGPCRDDDKDSTQCCELQAIYLDPSVWRSGHGSMMTTRVLEYARERSFSEVVLWVLERNQSARSFYERLGFAPDGACKVLEEGDWRATELRYRVAVGQPSSWRPK